jgi:hypothetical protein
MAFSASRTPDLPRVLNVRLARLEGVARAAESVEVRAPDKVADLLASGGVASLPLLRARRGAESCGLPVAG